jgi:hypothetical protein
MNLNLILAGTGKSLLKGGAAFVAHMEDAWEIYHMPYDPD